MQTLTFKSVFKLNLLLYSNYQSQFNHLLKNVSTTNSIKEVQKQKTNEQTLS